MSTGKPIIPGSDGGGGEAVSPIAFYLDPGSGAPTYRQLVQQAERALLLGYLRHGDQLPRVKDVTSSLAINADTVLKAYRELEHKGIAEGRPGLGTFIVADPPIPGPRELAGLRRSLSRWLRDAGAAGLDERTMAALFEMSLHDIHAATAGAVA
jgi:GntR family transcriptional regulator